MGKDSKIGWCDHTFNPWRETDRSERLSHEGLEYEFLSYERRRSAG